VGRLGADSLARGGPEAIKASVPRRVVKIRVVSDSSGGSQAAGVCQNNLKLRDPSQSAIFGWIGSGAGCKSRVGSRRDSRVALHRGRSLIQGPMIAAHPSAAYAAASPAGGGTN
jgi:hypothetical protein